MTFCFGISKFSSLILMDFQADRAVSSVNKQWIIK